MRSISATQIVLIHDRIIAKTGGRLGVREPSLLSAIEAKPRASFDTKELYPSIHDKAAATFESICNYHAFVDGNKRTAIACLEYFLHLNGYNLTASPKHKEQFVIDTAAKNPKLDDVAKWIRINSTKVGK